VGRYQAPCPIFINKIFDDCPGFGHRDFTIDNHGRLSQRVDGQQRRGRQHRFGVPLIALHLVRDAEFLQQPQHPLRPRIIEVVNDDHGLIVTQ
jgi:hypothetical protein